ncbi:ABC transporter permease [Humitalea sp. 24SJ18S-53]|uniref:ABC transporter permease n=1 Tax=Humitalea sp. 24SJ18S-53 TaxID=3422307 RepID=UPI003D672BC1
MSTTAIPRDRRFEWPAWLLLAPALACVAMFIVMPLVTVGVYSFWQRSPIGIVEQVFTLDNWREFFGDSFYALILWRSIRLSLLAMLTAALLGYPVAYTLSRMGDRWRAALILLLFLPSWISFVVRTMSWLHVLGPTGLVNMSLQRMGLIFEPLPLLYNDFAIYIGLVHYVITYMILNIYIGLQSVDRNVVDAARTLGASDWQAFLAVTLPLSLPGLSAGCLLCFILASGSYITPMLLGGPGNIYFPNLIYEAMVPQLDWPFGAALALVFILVLVAVLLVYARIVGLSHLTKRAA